MPSVRPLSITVALDSTVDSQRVHALLLSSGYVAALVDDRRIEVFIEPGQSEAATRARLLVLLRSEHGSGRHLRLMT